MIVEIWRDSRTGSTTTAPVATIVGMRRRGLISIDAVRLYRTNAESWEAAIVDYYRLMERGMQTARREPYA